MNIGFIGLGIMGAPMAGHLIAAGHKLFTTSARACRASCSTPARRLAHRRRRSRKQSDIVITMVPDTPDVEDGAVRRERRRRGPAPGKIVVDMSSISPIETKDFAKRINALGCDYLDAPVSGGEVGAKAATLTIMVGGPEAAFDSVKPLFELMGKNITLVGGNGDGQTARSPTRSSSR